MAYNLCRECPLVLNSSVTSLSVGIGAAWPTSAQYATIIGYGAGSGGDYTTLIGANSACKTSTQFATVIGAGGAINYTGATYSIALGAAVSDNYSGSAFMIGSTAQAMDVKESGCHMFFSGNNLLITGTGTSQTFSAAQIVDGLIVTRYSAGGTVTCTLPTAASVIALLPDNIVYNHTCWIGKILNNNYNSRTLAVVGNTGLTFNSFSGGYSVGQEVNFLAIVTSGTTITIYG